ncbi:aldehyde dehydrogenase family protein [Planktomarina temperata]|nr:aldehyde dehydrogenase family protein [Planktomarina temperata]
MFGWVQNESRRFKMNENFQISLPETRNLVSGRWVEGEGAFVVNDKFSGAAIADVHQATKSQVDEAIQSGLRAAEGNIPEPIDRAETLHRCSELIQKNKQRFIEILGAEAGFTTADAMTEVDRATVTLRLCAEEATNITGEALSFAASRGQHERLGFTLRVPIGVVCVITPFNSPLNTVTHKVGPAFAAGNAVVLKPAGLTPLSAALLCELLLEAGMPPNMLHLVQGSGRTTGNWLLSDQRIGFYSFTGSTEVGRTVRDGAGLRRCQLELGSIASTIICADADLTIAIPKTVNAGFRKAGQVCTSTQRLFVSRDVLEEVTATMLEHVSALHAGDPRLPETKVGPLITPAAAQRTSSWVAQAIEDGAQRLCGGELEGSVLQPTILTGVKSGMKVVDEEVFGPVVSIIPFDDLEAAISHANDTPYGLAAGVFTSNIGSALNAARKMRFGAVHINEASSARADAMPFGGVKDSGFGFEGPRYAIRELTEERVITVRP